MASNKETNSNTEVYDAKKDYKWKGKYSNGAAGGLYGLGFLGALIYEIQHATSIWVGLLGVVKALFWPGFLVYKLFEFLKI